MQISGQIFALAAIIGAGLQSVSAASLRLPRQSLSISSSCQTALTGLLSSPDAACLDVSAFASLAINSASITQTVDNWLSGVCSTGGCSDAMLSSIMGNLTSGCSQELSAIGLTATTEDDITTVVEKAYPTVRQMLCLKDETTGNMCTAETIQAFQNMSGSALSLSSATSLSSIANMIFSSGIENVTCTSCVKQAYNIAQTGFASLVADATSSLQDLCGASFTDGSPATDVSQTAPNTVFSVKGTSGAVANYVIRGFAKFSFMSTLLFAVLL